MYFILLALGVLFALLTGYAVIKGLWVFAIIFGILGVIVLIWMGKRYRKRKSKRAKSENLDGTNYWECLRFTECFSSSPGKRKGDCDCDDIPDCGGDCSF
jgi:Na+/melibiose symporter-like transporter